MSSPEKKNYIERERERKGTKLIQPKAGKEKEKEIVDLIWPLDALTDTFYELGFQEEEEEKKLQFTDHV